jgi:hypothetical protein
LIEVQESTERESSERGSSDRALENAVARALRENLGPLQRNAIDLEQAFDEFVAACSSVKPGAKPGDALPAMLRAQAFAASLSAGLSVLSNFTALALSSEGAAAVRERQVPAIPSSHIPASHVSSAYAPASAPLVTPPLADVQPAISEPEPREQADSATQAPVAATPAAAEPAVAPVYEQAQEQVPDHLQTVDAQAMEVEPQPAPAGAQAQDSVPSEAIPVLEVAPHPTAFEPELPEPAQPEQIPAATAEAAFDISTLPADIQDLHRRANRVAKVAMQDIKLLRPQDVQQGRENKDLCQRLRSDLDKARKEYDRRFRAIQDHPVDYFHRWAVDILAQGDEKALGEYPYPSPVLRH